MNTQQHCTIREETNSSSKHGDDPISSQQILGSEARQKHSEWERTHSFFVGFSLHSDSALFYFIFITHVHLQITIQIYMWCNDQSGFWLLNCTRKWVMPYRFSLILGYHCLVLFHVWYIHRDNKILFFCLISF